MSYIVFAEEIEGETFHIVSPDDMYAYGDGIATFDLASAKHAWTETVHLFESWEAAARHVREYWADMAENDSESFVDIIGSDTLVSWALGKLAGPGYIKVSSLAEWLDLYSDEAEILGYFGAEDSIELLETSEHIIEKLGFKPLFAITQG